MMDARVNSQGTSSTAELLDMLYRVASDPDGWAELVDVLPLETGGEARAPELEEHLERSIDIATRVSERASAGGWRRPDCEVRLSSDLRVKTLNAAARAASTSTSFRTGSRLPLAAPAGEEILREAAARALASRRPVAMPLHVEGTPSVVFALLDATDDGFQLTFRAGQGGVAHLDRWLGLTPAEARLANQLTQSDGLKAAAKALGVSVNTARNQLAAIFAKLGIGRQSELVQLLTELSGLGLAAAEAAGAPAPRLQFLNLPDGRQLSFRDYGASSSRVLMTLHEGLGSSLLPPQTHALALRLGLRIIAPDRPGFGSSTRLRPYSFGRVAEDLEALCEHLDVTEVSLAGVLSGAVPALAFAAAAPKRIRKVVLLSGRPPQPTAAPPDNALLAFRARLERHDWARLTIFRLLRTRLSPSFAERMLLRATLRSPGDRAFLQTQPDFPAFASACAAEALAGGGVGPADEMAALPRTDLDLAQIRAPISVFHGMEDRLAPLGDLRAYLGDHPYELKVFGEIGQLMAFKHWEEILSHVASATPRVAGLVARPGSER